MDYSQEYLFTKFLSGTGLRYKKVVTTTFIGIRTKFVCVIYLGSTTYKGLNPLWSTLLECPCHPIWSSHIVFIQHMIAFVICFNDGMASNFSFILLVITIVKSSCILVFTNFFLCSELFDIKFHRHFCNIRLLTL